MEAGPNTYTEQTTEKESSRKRTQIEKSGRNSDESDEGGIRKWEIEIRNRRKRIHSMKERVKKKMMKKKEHTF